ncbi:MAG: 1-(5-phosphoribosyl)-5-[(5-phosphoribosylamino)methylideneamino]imidazole-4-carboxamide isomerase [bacterium]
MQIIPAIDLKDGNCVRLLKGDFAQATVYSDDPMEMARKFIEAGAKRIHIIDLDGAKTGEQTNLSSIRMIADLLDVKVQCGGGIRTIDRVKELLSNAIDRIILGTILFDEMLLQEILPFLTQQPERLIAALDAKEGKVVTHGWVESTGETIVEKARKLATLGFQRILVTDVAVDGTLEGPNIALYEQLVKEQPMKVIASGGVSSQKDLDALEKTGVEAVVVGKAIYSGALDLAQLKFNP